MKKYLILTIVSLLIFQTKVISQISLINTYDDAVYVVDIEDVGYKYYGIDFETSQCKIYNMDHTLWKTIDVVPPVNNYINEIAYVSTKLFNNDSNIELLVVFSEYIETSDTSGYYIYTTKVINENRVTFLDVPGGGYSIIYKIDETEANFLVYIYDFSVSPINVTTNIYSIPGTPYTLSETNLGITLKNAFPNPSRSFINVPYDIAQSSTSADIIIYNELGAEVYRNKINSNENVFRLNTNRFSKGVYFYKIESNGYASPSRKIVIQ